MQIAVLALPALAAVATLVYWTVAMFKVLRTRASVPTARAGLSMPPPEGGWPTVCVVIPAHNEREVIGQLVTSLRAQDYPNMRVVLSLDRCTDDTAAVAREAAGGDERFEIFEITQCPEGWAGKVHAVHAGATRSNSAPGAELLVFADADTAFEPGAIRACVALLRSRGLDMLSLLSTLTHDRWFERAVQPAASLELMRQYPITRANKREGRRAFANGQFMLFTREGYQAVGGHVAVKDELLEDLALARRMAHAKRPAGVVLADGLLSCRMYHSWEQFVRGWTRIYIEAAKRRPDRMERSAWQTRIMGCVAPLLACALAPLAALVAPEPARAALIALGLAATLAYFAGLALAYASGRTPIWCVLLHPYGAWRTASILARGAFELRTGVPTVWAGKSYVRPVRHAGSPE